MMELYQTLDCFVFLVNMKWYEPRVRYRAYVALEKSNNRNTSLEINRQEQADAK